MPRYALDNFVIDTDSARLWLDGEPVDAQPLVIQMLAYLTERKGQVVSRDELAAHLWPDVQVTDHSLTQAAHKLRRALGDHRDWIATVPRKGFRLDAPVKSLRRRTGPPPPPMRPRLHGRDAELAQVEAWLGAGDRLVSITGPGGIGKTTVLTEIGHRMGVSALFAPLGDATDRQDLCRALAGALDATVPGDVAVSAIAELLRRRGPTVLLLDNFEQLAKSETATVQLWLRACPDLQVVISTRIALRLVHERRLALGPLPLPEGNDATSLSESAAGALFLERARAADPDLQLGDGDIAAIAALCRELDGLPLALELAAARVRLIPPKKLLDTLGRRLHSLKNARRDAPARHESLAAAIEWSFTLLDAAQADAMARLSVFEGDFDFDAAGAVLGDEALERVEDLLDHSLLRRLPRGRFGLFATIRAHAAQHLPANSDASERHARHFVERAEAGDIEAADVDNLLAASRWAALRDDGLALRSHAALMRVLRRNGPIAAALPSLEAALTLPRPAEIEAELRMLRADAFRLLGRREEAARDLRRASTLAPGGDLAGRILHAQALVHRDNADSARAEEAFETAIAHFRTANTPDLESRALREHGELMCQVGRYADSERLLSQASALAAATADRAGLAAARGAMGRLQHARGELHEARQGMEEALAFLEESGDAVLASVALQHLAPVLAELGEHEAAHEALDRAENLQEQTGQLQLLAFTRGKRGQLWLAEQALEAAWDELSSAVELCRQFHLAGGEGTFRSSLAVIHARRAEDEAARRELALAQALLETADSALDLLEVHLRRARLDAASDPIAAHRAAAQATALRDRIELPPDSRLHRELVDIHRRLDAAAFLSMR